MNISFNFIVPHYSSRAWSDFYGLNIVVNEDNHCVLECFYRNRPIILIGRLEGLNIDLKIDNLGWYQGYYEERGLDYLEGMQRWSAKVSVSGEVKSKRQLWGCCVPCVNPEAWVDLNDTLFVGLNHQEIVIEYLKDAKNLIDECFPLSYSEPWDIDDVDEEDEEEDDSVIDEILYDELKSIRESDEANCQLMIHGI